MIMCKVQLTMTVKNDQLETKGYIHAEGIKIELLQIAVHHASNRQSEDITIMPKKRTSKDKDKDAKTETFNLIQDHRIFIDFFVIITTDHLHSLVYACCCSCQSENIPLRI